MDGGLTDDLSQSKTLPLMDQPVTCAWRNVISSSPGHVQCYVRSLYVIHSKGALNYGEAVRPGKVDMFSRRGRPTGIKVRSPLAWAASAEDNKVDEAD